MKRLCLLILFVSTVFARQEIYIGGVFPMTGGWSGGQACLPAAMMAIDDVNERKDVLPGYKITMIDKDSKCDAGLGLRKFYDILQDERIFTVLTGCSSVSTPIAESAYLWRLNVIAYGASSPALSNRSRFPTFFRTHPSANLHNPIRIRLFQQFGWRRIAIISEEAEVFSTTAEDLRQRISDEGMDLVIHQTFYDDPGVAVRNLKKVDVRIIVGLFYEGMARKVMCQAFKNGIYGQKYVWFLIGWYQHDWHVIRKEKINCSIEQMQETVDGHFTTEIMMFDPSDQKTVSGMRSSKFVSRLNKKLGKGAQGKGGYAEAPLAYDAVWAFALALNSTITRISPSDLTRKSAKISKAMYQSLNISSFPGISGRVVFDSDGSRMAITEVQRFQNGSYVTIMFYDTQSNNITWKNKIGWVEPPRDRMLSVIEKLQLSQSTFIAVGGMAGLCILFCFSCLVFNWVHREKSQIVNSIPVLNSLSVLGCFLLITAVYAFAINEITDTLCEIRACLLTFGFSLAFSPLFAKLWTTNTLYKQSLMKQRRRRKRAEIKLSVTAETVAVIAVAFVVDVLVLITWFFVDPLHRTQQQLSAVQTGDDSIVIPELQQCSCNHFNLWVGIMFAYKGIQLLLGSFLAYESRCKIDSNSDHKKVAIAVYNVTMLCFFCAPVTLLITGKPDISFLFVSAPILACAFASNVIIFVPKWHQVKRNIRLEISSSSRRLKRPLTMGSSKLSSNHVNSEAEEVLLERENEILRQKIAEKEREIEECRRRRRSTTSSNAAES
uniref:Gamma-aminobutyric acid type B receptor subunit 1 n=1 Tax=Phallusia mammillata TaxID=59560 RepID=A0A6F9DE24_9ASCI|nr:gamma-aminobutyric acid type B receptor subunit 1 [Phallusia mammillata]